MTSTLSYIGLKTLVTLLRLTQPGPKPNTIHPSSTIHIPSRDPNRTIKAHVYNPPNPALTKTPTPILLNCHGSGFVFPLHGSDDVFCSLIARETGHTVLDISYRLAPEHPFPAAPNDVEDAIRYVLAHPSTYDLSHFSLSGFSAGGNLVLSTIAAGLFPPETFRAVISFYAPLDLSLSPDDKKAPDESGPTAIPRPVAKIFDACYIAGHETSDVKVSPGLMGDVERRMPRKVMLVSCAWDWLAGETESFGERVENEGGKGRELVRRRVEGVGHAWDKACKAGSEEERKREEMYGLAVEMLRV